MFKSKKKLEEIEKIKKELNYIKEQMGEKNKLIDINNLYVWECNGKFNIVNLDIKEIYGRTWIGAEVKAYKSTLKDIFTNEVIYILRNTRKIRSREKINDGNKQHIAYLKPICKVNKKLKLYPNKKVPLYILQEMYNQINNVDNKEIILKKNKI